jgi:hypothetical protein
MKKLILTLSMVLMAFAAQAEDHRDLSSEAPRKSASAQIREYAQNCFDSEMALFETRRGRLPSDEEADFIIDACANPKFKK